MSDSDDLDDAPEVVQRAHQELDQAITAGTGFRHAAAAADLATRDAHGRGSAGCRQEVAE
jgi:hypothetical protein